MVMLALMFGFALAVAALLLAYAYQIQQDIPEFIYLFPAGVGLALQLHVLSLEVYTRAGTEIGSLLSHTACCCKK